MFTFSHQLDTFSINITKQSLWINMSHYWLTSVFASCLLSSSGSLQAKLAGAGRRADEGGGGVRWQQRGSDGRGRWHHPLWGPSAVVLYHCLDKMNKMCITGTLCVGKNMSVDLVFRLRCSQSSGTSLTAQNPPTERRRPCSNHLVSLVHPYHVECTVFFQFITSRIQFSSFF